MKLILNTTVHKYFSTINIFIINSSDNYNNFNGQQLHSSNLLKISISKQYVQSKNIQIDEQQRTHDFIDHLHPVYILSKMYYTAIVLGYQRKSWKFTIHLVILFRKYLSILNDQIHNKSLYYQKNFKQKIKINNQILPS